MTEGPGGRTSRPPRESTGGGHAAARRFRVVRGLLRGYFHEDFLAEHGSIEDAVRAFCRDATPDEIRRLRQEWRVLSSLTAEWDIDEIVSLLTRDLGGAWAPATKRDVALVTRALAAASPDPE